MTKPSTAELAMLVDVSGLSSKDIAERCGVAHSTARGWIAEMRAERGETRQRSRAQAVTRQTRDEIRDIAAMALNKHLETLERLEQIAHAPGDLARLAKLWLDLRAHALDTEAHAPQEQRLDARPELLERVRAATASAEATPR